MSSGGQPEFSPNIYDDLKQYLRENDRDRAAQLIDRLLSSGRPLGEILAEILPPVGSGENDVRVNADGKPQVLAPASSARLDPDDPSTSHPAASSTVERLIEQSGRSIAGRVTLAEELVPAWQDKRDGIGGQGVDTGPLLRDQASIAPSAMSAGEPLRHDSQMAASGEPDPRSNLRLVVLCLAAAIASAAVAGILFVNPPAGNWDIAGGQRAGVIHLAHLPTVAEAVVEPRKPAGEPESTAIPRDMPGQPDRPPEPSALAEVKDPPPAAAAVQAPGPEPQIVASGAESAERETVVQSAEQAPAAKTESPRLSATEIAALVARGDALLTSGDVTSARLFYRYGADAGDGAAAFRLGASFDPAFLSRARLPAISGDPGQAMHWYRRARDLGNGDADILLRDLAPTRK